MLCSSFMSSWLSVCVIVIAVVAGLGPPATAAQPAGESALDRLAQVRSGADPLLDELAAFMPRVEIARRNMAASPRDEVVRRLDAALRNDPRFAPGSHGRTAALRALEEVDALHDVKVGAQRPDIPIRDGIEPALPIADPTVAEWLITGLLAGGRDADACFTPVMFRTPIGMRQRTLDRLAPLRNAGSYEPVLRYVTLLTIWAPQRPADMAFCLALATNDPGLPAAARTAMAESIGWADAQNWPALRTHAFVARWRMGLLMEDLPRLESADPEAKAQLYPALLGGLQADNPIPLADADVPRVWRSIEVYFGFRPDHIPTGYAPEQAMFSALRSKRSPEALREIHRVVRGLAITQAARQGAPQGKGAELVDHIMANPEKYPPTAPADVILPP